MSLPYGQSYTEAPTHKQPAPVPVTSETWSHSLPTCPDRTFESFSQLLAANSFTTVDSCAESSSGETYDSTPESLCWPAPSYSPHTLSKSLPNQTLSQHSGIDIDATPRDQIQTVDESRRVKRRAQNRAAQHTFKARQQQRELKLCEKIRIAEQANANLRGQNIQLMEALKREMTFRLEAAARQGSRTLSSSLLGESGPTGEGGRGAHSSP